MILSDGFLNFRYFQQDHAGKNHLMEEAEIQKLKMSIKRSASLGIENSRNFKNLCQSYSKLGSTNSQSTRHLRSLNPVVIDFEESRRTITNLRPSIIAKLDNAQSSTYNEPEEDKEKSNLKRCLKRLFEYYCKFGERNNIYTLKPQKYFKLCVDANLMGKQFSKANAELFYTAASSGTSSRVTPNKHLNFEEFLVLLEKISESCYSESDKATILLDLIKSEELSFLKDRPFLRHLLMNKILPLSKRLSNEDIDINQKFSPTKRKSSVFSSPQRQNAEKSSFASQTKSLKEYHRNSITVSTAGSILISQYKSFGVEVDQLVMESIDSIYNLYKNSFRHELTIIDNLNLLKKDSEKVFYKLCRQSKLSPYLVDNWVMLEIYESETKAASSVVEYPEIYNYFKSKNKSSKFDEKLTFGKMFTFIAFLRSLIKIALYGFSRKEEFSSLEDQQKFEMLLEKLNLSPKMGNIRGSITTQRKSLNPSQQIQNSDEIEEDYKEQFAFVIEKYSGHLTTVFESYAKAHDEKDLRMNLGCFKRFVKTLKIMEASQNKKQMKDEYSRNPELVSTLRLDESKITEMTNNQLQTPITKLLLSESQIDMIYIKASNYSLIYSGLKQNQERKSLILNSEGLSIDGYIWSLILIHNLTTSICKKKEGFDEFIESINLKKGIEAQIVSRITIGRYYEMLCFEKVYSIMNDCYKIPFHVYSGKLINEGKMNFEELLRFCTHFEIFPQKLTKSKIMIAFNSQKVVESRVSCYRSYLNKESFLNVLLEFSLMIDSKTEINDDQELLNNVS